MFLEIDHKALKMFFRILVLGVERFEEIMEWVIIDLVVKKIVMGADSGIYLVF